MKSDSEFFLLTRLLGDNPAVMLWVDDSFNLIWANESCRHRFGISDHGSIDGKCFVYRSHTGPCQGCPVKKVFETGQPCSALIRLDGDPSTRKPDSSWVVEASAVKGSGGEPLGAFVIAHDSTECEWIRKELDKKNQHLSELVEAINDIVWTCDEKGAITYVNLAMEKILGYSRDEYITKSKSELMHPEDLARIEKEVPRLISSKKGWRNSIVRWKHKNGSWRELESSAIPIFDSEGEVIGFRGIDRDVSERSILMAQLAQAQKMEAMGRFAGGIAHDSNNLLGVILGYSEVILDGMDPSEEIRRALEQIRTAAQRSAELTKQLLTYARKQVAKPEVIDLNEKVSKELNLLRRLIGEDITLAWKPGAELWLVKIDHNQVDQVLTNLCINSRDAIEGVGEITISTSNIRVTKSLCRNRTGLIPGYFVLMKIRDTGQGIDNGIIDHIFDPFFTTKPVGQGTGLGLSTVFGIVKQNEGFVYAFSEPGVYTEFEVYLPRYMGKISTESEIQEKEVLPTGTESILLVEDDEAKLEIVELFLKKLGYRVTGERNPAEALSAFKEHPDNFDLLLTDMVMPEMGGRQLKDRLLEIDPKLKYIFMSGHGLDAESPIQIDENEAFLQKPFTRRELAIKVRDVLDSDPPG